MRAKSTQTLTRDQIEAAEDEAREDHRIMRSLRNTLRTMDIERKTALLIVARELASPGSAYETIFNCPSDKPARMLGLA
jgi:hypothetical protein